jgi:hypothetical protein
MSCDLMTDLGTRLLNVIPVNDQLVILVGHRPDRPHGDYKIGCLQMG